MEVFFSRHARRQMKWRKISDNEARRTVIDPEKIEPSTGYRKNAFKHINNKWIKVTFVEENNIITVVTVINKNN